MKILLIGAPGAGKGTQAVNLSNWFKIPAISTGEIIRKHLKAGTELGKKVKIYMDSGNLVPDDIVIDIVRERISETDCKSGFILDGFPRTVEQAISLDKIAKVDIVLSIEVEDSIIVKRLSGRRVCEKCGDTYHMVSNPPLREGICNTCQHPLVLRDDDKPETVVNRLAIFHKQSEPVKEYYKKQGILFSVGGRDKVSDTTAEVKRVLEMFLL